MEYVASLLRGVEGLCQQLFSRHSLHAICRLCRQGLCSLVPSYGHFVFTPPDTVSLLLSGTNSAPAPSSPHLSFAVF